jgi:NAD-dependent DNA ligase
MAQPEDRVVGPAFRGPIGYRLAHELEGILTGIAADTVINHSEVQRLRAWVSANEQFADVRPFSELVEHVNRALDDGVLTTDECEDLLWVTRKLTTVNPYFDALRGGVQQLMGLLAGVVADQVVNALEVESLSNWVDEWQHLSGLWPYDECNAIVTAAMAHTLTKTHVDQLRALAAQFPVAGQQPTDGATPPLLIGGICAVDPTVTFRDKTFVFTGESRRAPREELANAVMTLGGAEARNVSRHVDYLVVCDGGSALWAFSCYGRKVEKAYEQRRAGHHIAIVHEVDFWDALAGHGAAFGA